MKDEINVRFKELRKALGLTTVAFGDAIGMANSSVSNIESGQRNVTDKHIKLICATYPHVSEVWLRTGEGDMFNQSSNNAIDQLCAQCGMGDVARTALRLYAGLTDEHKAVISDYLRNVVAEVAKTAIPAPDDDEAIKAELLKQRQASESDNTTA